MVEGGVERSSEIGESPKVERRQEAPVPPEFLDSDSPERADERAAAIKAAVADTHQQRLENEVTERVGIHQDTQFNERGERLITTFDELPSDLPLDKYNTFSGAPAEHFNEGEPMYRVVGVNNVEYAAITQGVEDRIADGSLPSEDRDSAITRDVDALYEARARGGEYFMSEPPQSVDDALLRNAVATEWHAAPYDGVSVRTESVTYRSFEVHPSLGQKEYIGRTRSQGMAGGELHAELIGGATQIYAPKTDDRQSWWVREIPWRTDDPHED